MDTNKQYRLIITIKKTKEFEESTSKLNIIKRKPLFTMRDLLFNKISEGIFINSITPPDQWTKEQRDDPHKEFIFNGTEKECIDYKNNIIDSNKSNKLLPRGMNTYIKFSKWMLKIGVLFQMEIKEPE